MIFFPLLDSSKKKKKFMVIFNVSSNKTEVSISKKKKKFLI